ncbi:hypothetical protein BC332_21344 [Capsicum chinense]|nr:hypothetical protein BC332_21344 [Capsicum chinense]
MGKNLEDRIKIGILYFIQTFVFSQLDKANIPVRDFHKVDDRSYSHFSWGKLVFAKLMVSISRSMNEVKQYYRLNVVRENNLIPKMVNWKVVKAKPSYEDLMEDMFGKIKNVDNEPAAGEKKESLSKSDLGSIKSYVKTYVDMKFNDLQKLMVDHYTGFMEVVKESLSSYDKVTHYPVHESEKDISNRKGYPPQSLNEHNTDAKSDNIVEDVGQSSKVGGNEGEADECLKMKIHLTMHVPPLPDAYPTGITDSSIVAIGTCNLQGNTDSQSYISDSAIIAISQGSFYWVLAVIVLKERCIHVYSSLKGHRECIDWSLLEAYKEKMDQYTFDVQIVDGIVQKSSAYTEYLSDGHQIPSSDFDKKIHCTRYASLLWDYGVNKESNEYVSDNQNPPRPKRTFIPSEDIEMIDVES